ncbi:hypothetical protein [Burkholderia vietnamiensis]|uniref:hypothetical protein n=1 Tax=Burkholderia vietnamiensis TaxID=60552 RepID=UPI000AE25AE7|nr:hypothetical protein [Burkholderia vietnamiensis]
MDAFDDFHKIYDADHPNMADCLKLRAEELLLRTKRRSNRFNDRIAVVCGMIMLFTSGAALHMVWLYGLGNKIPNSALLVCCIGAPLGLFFVLAPIRHKQRAEKITAQLKSIESALTTLNCPAACQKLGRD